MWFSLLGVESQAPDFTLQAASGETVTLSAFRGTQAVVLIFYPANFTPGCTSQLCMFRDAYAELSQSGVQVLGINPGKPDDHAAFASAQNLPFPLLSDPGMRVSRQYKAVLIPGLLQNRVVYGIDTAGAIRFAAVGNPPVQQVLAALQKS
jgi:peroxiredoxin